MNTKPPRNRSSRQPFNTVNDPGTREKHGATVIQMARRSEQLDGIAGFVVGALSASSQMDEQGNVTLTAQQAHRLRGYCEQLGIIADELRGAQK